MGRTKANTIVDGATVSKSKSSESESKNRQKRSFLRFTGCQSSRFNYFSMQFRLPPLHHRPRWRCLRLQHKTLSHPTSINRPLSGHVFINVRLHPLLPPPRLHLLPPHFHPTRFPSRTAMDSLLSSIRRETNIASRSNSMCYSMPKLRRPVVLNPTANLFTLLPNFPLSHPAVILLNPASM